jgi:hypothetical protein
MNLAQARSKLPELNGLDDQSAFELIHQNYYPGWDKAYLAQQLGYQPPAPEPKPAGVLRTAGDVGIKLAQGVVDLGASAVGLGSLATGGLLGQGMRAIGYDPKTTNAMLGEYLSESQKASDDKVQQADGFMNTLAAAANNPRAILGSVAESAPGMLAGMGVTSAVARGIAAKAALATVEGAAASAAELAAGRSAAHATQGALGTAAGKTAASDAVEAAGAKLLGLGAATEGAQSAGQIADDAQAAGRAWSDYALPAVAAGTITAGIGYGAGRLMGDSATQLATGARSTGVKGNMAARLGKEAFSEGVLEEMPQSAQEQVFTNIAQGEADNGKGVGNAAATGLLVGGAMGAGMGVMQPHHASPTHDSMHEPIHEPRPEPVQLQDSGPLSQAANAGQAAAAAIQAQATPATPSAAPATNTQAPLSLAQIDARMAELVAIGHGKKAQKTWDADGNLVKQPAIAPRRLTQQETAEYHALEQARADRTAIPPEQQAEYEALLSDEKTAQEQKSQQAKQAAAAERAAQEEAQLNAMLAEEAAQRDAQARQAELEAQQQAAQQAQITNAIVEHDNRQRAEANRAALRSAVLNDQTIAPERKKPAFLAALRCDGYINPQLTPDDHHEIDLATTPVKGLPNELVDAVPERKEAPKPDARAPNLKAVDDAIAAGMRLRTSNGAVLHKKGSSKIFRLNQEQKAYYLKQMAKPAAVEVAEPQLENAPQADLSQTDGQAQVEAANEEPFEPEQAPAEPPQAPLAQPDSVITIPHDIDHDWHMPDDIKTRGHSQDGWQWVGQNLNGHDLFEKDGQRRVIEGDTAITESSNKPEAHRVVEFRTQDEVRAEREALNLPVPAPQANNSDTTSTLHDTVGATNEAEAPPNPTTISTEPNDSTEQGTSHDNRHHQHRSPDSAGAQPLGELATTRNQGVEGAEDLQSDHASQGDTGASPDTGTDADPARPGPRSGRDRAAPIHPAATGGRALRPETEVGARHGRRNGREGSALAGDGGRTVGDGSALGTRGHGRTGGGQRAAETGNGRTAGETERISPAQVSGASEVAATPNIPATNFRISDLLRLGQGGEVAKFNDNLAAIRTLRAIEAENRRASPAEQAILARYVGWGGLANAFPSPESGQFKSGWEQRGPELAQLINPKEYAQARRSTLDAHYTSQTVVTAMWQATQRMGFSGGLALESSVGTGNFIGLLPDTLRGHTRFVGVELDSLTARIAQLLYPQETILNSGLQKVPLADAAFDLAIGNPPFGEQSLRFQFKPELSGQSIHNQFFLAAIDAVKPGGLLVQVVSRYLLDRKDASARRMLAKKARLLGAIRLPDTAFRENARTHVVTDIVFLQRLTPAEEADMQEAFHPSPLKERVARIDGENPAPMASVPEWVETTAIADPLGGEAIEVNRYFAANPHMIMGVLERSGSMQYKNDVTVRLDKGHNLAEMLNQAMTHLPQSVMATTPDAIAASLARHQSMSDSLRMALAGHEAGSIQLEPGNVLVQVFERETPEGGHELARRVLTPSSPWSDRLFQDAAGQ